MSTNAGRRFWVVLGVITIAALGIRVVYVTTVARHDHHFYDAAYYHLQANANAQGAWFRNPFPFQDNTEPAADHAPLTALVLTPVAYFVDDLDDNLLAMRYTFAFLGAVVVGVVGLLGREIAGDRVGWVAAGIAALYPYLWVNDGLVMSETLAAGFSSLILLLTFRLLRRPGIRGAVALGAACGFATLARAELALFVPLVVLPAAWILREPLRRRGAIAAAAVGTAVVVLAPWTALNFSRFEEPVFVSTQDGLALLGSNCGDVYSGPATGLWGVGCAFRVEGDQSVESARYREAGLEYITSHLRRYPVVVLARVGRTWSVFRPLDMLSMNEFEGRPSWVTGLGLGFYYPLLVAAIIGTFVLRRRGTRVWPLLMPAVIVTLLVFPAYGLTRFRVPAEPSIVVLAAVAVVAGLQRLRPRGPATPIPETPDLSAATS